MGLAIWFWGTSVDPGTRFAKNTLLNKNACLVYCLLWFHDIYWSRFNFCKICLLGWPLGRCPPHEKIAVPNSKDCQILSVLTEVCNAHGGVLITHIAVTVLWCPLVGLKSRSEWDLIWLPMERTILRNLGLGCQCKTDGSPVQHSCPKLL